MTMNDLRRAFAKVAAQRAAENLRAAIRELKSVSETAEDPRFDQVVFDLELLRQQVVDEVFR